jgi:methionyl-tRNA formyltransferase
MRLIVLGTGPFAVPMFGSLLDSPHQVLALVTRPTPPAKGREKTPINPMRALAESRGLAVHAPESINSDSGKELLKTLAPELLVVCDYGQILAADVLAIPPLGGINLHASLLPKYRGAAPIQWALLRGEAETGVSVIHMSPRLDAGNILTTRSTLIGSDETHPELEARLAQLGIEAVGDAIGMLARWDRVAPLGQPQDASQATKAPRLKKEHGAIQWTHSAEQIRNQVRALKPWPGTFTFWRRPGHEPLRLVVDQVSILGHGIRAGARVAELDVEIAESLNARLPQHEPGGVIVSDGKQLIVATGEGALSITAIAPAGKRHMSTAEFLRGYRVKEGDRFGPANE